MDNNPLRNWYVAVVIICFYVLNSWGHSHLINLNETVMRAEHGEFWDFIDIEVEADHALRGAIDLVRSAVMQVPVNQTAVVMASVSSLLWLIIGISYFRRTEYYFADLV